MRRKKIMWRIYTAFLVSAMTAFAAMAWYATLSLRWFHQDQVVPHIVLGWLIVASLFAVVTWLLSRRISRPLEDMRRVAERIACGDLEARVARPDSEELGDLARTLNQMAAQLGERLSTITRQRNEQEAVLASMVEGVLAVDRDERILHLNHAAARLLDLAPEQARGRSIQEAVRNRDLQAFIDATLAGTGPAEGEIVIYGNEERFLQLHGTALTDIAGYNIGALIVLNDITRLKRLETVRRDFVANVSHQLKTPITALKGCVETLS
ncbi:MAG: HAMP domain-containing protein, partial [Verrucomicrobia bacterium]|nr:HAMP domain-containing protein [Verrucomicrobiota bacterium]